jgi:hypothetical protein
VARTVGELGEEQVLAPRLVDHAERPVLVRVRRVDEVVAGLAAAAVDLGAVALSLQT